MKAVSFVILLAVLAQVSLSVYSEPEQGLCNVVPTQCSNTLQRKGICCKVPTDPQLIYFRNSCLACFQGCDSFFFKTVLNTRCDDHELQGL